MVRRRIRKQSPRLVLLTILGASLLVLLSRHEGSPPVGTERGKATETLNILPQPAQTFHELRAEGPALRASFGSSAAAVSSERLVWSVNGERVGEGRALGPEHFHRGDRVAVQLTGANSARAEVVIANSRPQVRSVTIRRGDDPRTVQAFVEAADPDGDPLRLEYRWTVDGDRLSRTQEATLDIRRLPSSAEVGCTVVAHDGESASTPLACAPHRLHNQPPRVEVAGAAMLSGQGDGRTGRLPLRLSDPDGDGLTVEILAGPQDARWDADAGCVIWKAEAAIPELRIRVTDGRGGSSEMSFRLGQGS